ncbi:hypothetical protein SUGI_0541490 [Cryptomeria japonica]|nr:hypothetical protein SUGI_0541490 [Cryptomeria japonica]
MDRGKKRVEMREEEERMSVAKLRKMNPILTEELNKAKHELKKTGKELEKTRKELDKTRLEVEKLKQQLDSGKRIRKEKLKKLLDICTSLADELNEILEGGGIPENF